MIYYLKKYNLDLHNEITIRKCDDIVMFVITYHLMVSTEESISNNSYLVCLTGTLDMNCNEMRHVASL